MALIAGSGLIATVAATGLLLSFAYDNIRDASITEMRQIAGSYAADIERSMSTGVELTANLRSGLTAMKKGGDADRARADLLLRTVLEDSPSVLGTWTGWEPNAFDGKDADFVGKEGHDATGRYVPYWVRNSGKISHQALIDYTIPGNGDYYQLAFTQRKTVIVEPYLYDIGGEKVAMTSIATPILWEGKAVGVAGMDISLAETHKTLSAVKPMGTGFLGLVTGAGVIVSHPDSGLTAKSIKDAGDKTAAWGDLIAHPGDAVQTAGADGAPLISVAMPVKLTPDLNWYAIVSVPKAAVFAKLYGILWSAAPVSGASALRLGLAVWFIARKLNFAPKIGEDDPKAWRCNRRWRRRWVYGPLVWCRERGTGKHYRPLTRVQPPQDHPGAGGRGQPRPRGAGTPATLRLPCRTRGGDPLCRRRARPWAGETLGWRHDRAAGETFQRSPGCDPQGFQRLGGKAAGRTPVLLSECRDHPGRLGGNPRRGRRSGLPHRAAGGLGGADRRGAGGNHHLGQGFDPARRRSRFARRPHQTGGGALRRDRAQCGGGDERHRGILAIDLQHHRRHRRHRLPDQPAGPECRCRGGTGR